MIVKYKSLYKQECTVYLVRYPDEKFYRVIVRNDDGEIVKNEVVESYKWLAGTVFENIVHSEGKKEGGEKHD
jgi:hypothetical protein